MRDQMNIVRKLAAGLGFALVGATASAAILHLEEFNSDPGANVTDRDGFMTTAYDGGNDWVTGTFPLLGFNVPQEDAFVISLPEFTGNYSDNGLTQISFQMFAVNVLPSDLFIRIIDGANIFSYQFNPIAGMLNNWQTFTVDLAWSYGWSGSSENDFNSALGAGGVDWIEIQLSRNTAAAQEYRLDNLQTLDTDIGNGGPGDPGGPSAVPEPNTISLLFFVAAAGTVLRRHFVTMTRNNV